MNINGHINRTVLHLDIQTSLTVDKFMKNSSGGCGPGLSNVTGDSPINH